MVRRLGFAVAGVAAVVLGALALPAPASAHVTVNPREAVQGGFGRVAFRVPTESDTASTTKLEVHLPEDAPVGSVSTMPVPGWTVTIRNRKLAQPLDVHGSQVTEVVSVITWTATGDAAIRPGQFQEFPISLGPLPKVDKMVFRVLQTYSDGTIARWIEPPAADGKEPENPAPVLKLTPAPNPSASAAFLGTGSGPNPGPDSGSNSGSDSDGLAVGLGVAGLVAGLAGAALGGLAYLRTRRATG